MNTEEIKNIPSGSWICKKSKMPFYGGDVPPAVIFNSVRPSKTRTILRVTVQKTNCYFFDSEITLDNNINCEIIQIDEKDAILLNALWEESQKLVKWDKNMEGNPHISSHSGQPKVQFKQSNFSKSLYSMRLKNPSEVYNAYECPVCNTIHIGRVKEQKKETLKSPMKKIVFPEPEDDTINIDSLVVDRPIIGYQYVNSKERGAIVIIEDKFIDRKKDKLVFFDRIDMNSFCCGLSVVFLGDCRYAWFLCVSGKVYCIQPQVHS